MTTTGRLHVFIGSSSEGREVAVALHGQIASPDCEVRLWDQGVFEPGAYTLDALITEAHRSDFAVIVATPDDMRESRGETAAVPRDNVLLEYGLFAGVLGRTRTFILAVDGVSLPTDLLGVTRLTYLPQQNLRSAVAAAAYQVREKVQKTGRRSRHPDPTNPGGGTEGHESPLEAELALLRSNAAAQGWRVAKETPTTLRLISPKGKAHVLHKMTSEATRQQLRLFAATLRAHGLRVNAALRRPVSDSPFSR